MGTLRKTAEILLRSHPLGLSQAGMEASEAHVSGPGGFHMWSADQLDHLATNPDSDPGWCGSVG